MINKFNQKDEKIRKHWLYFTLGFFLLYPVLLYLLVTKILPPDYTIYSPCIADSFSSDHAIACRSSFLFWMIPDLLLIFSFYYCAYKKPGTNLLAFLSYVELLAIPIMIALTLSGWMGIPLNLLNLGVFSLEMIALTWWIYLCHQLKKVNKKIQAQKCPEYLQRLEALENVASLENLDKVFSDLINAWPQFKSLTIQEYKLKKAMLSEIEPF
jgi:hypothetical protein